MSELSALLILLYKLVKRKYSLGVSHANWALPMSSYALDAFASIGVPAARDFSSGILLGAQYTPLTVAAPNEERSSSEASFYRAAAGRPNLNTYTHALAKQILFDSSKRATGLMVQSENTTFSLHARREIVLSAGAVRNWKEFF